MSPAISGLTIDLISTTTSTQTITVENDNEAVKGEIQSFMDSFNEAIEYLKENGFDTNLIRASQSLGADTMRTFFKVIMPLILPGVISGGLFAFITSFDEVVIVMFIGSVEQITIPKQMWAGLRQETSPVILCMATCLVALSIALLTTVEMLRRRSERLRGINR